MVEGSFAIDAGTLTVNLIVNNLVVDTITLNNTNGFPYIAVTSVFGPLIVPSGQIIDIQVVGSSDLSPDEVPVSVMVGG
jgi:hypothetical protein